MSEAPDDEHVIAIKRTRAIAGRRYVYAACDCGWEATARESRREALSDGDAHLLSPEGSSD